MGTLEHLGKESRVSRQTTSHQYCSLIIPLRPGQSPIKNIHQDWTIYRWLNESRPLKQEGLTKTVSTFFSGVPVTTAPCNQSLNEKVITPSGKKYAKKTNKKI